MKTKIFGHRGAMGSYPENTMLGFTKAIEMGVDGLEADVHLTKDKKVVVIHDATLDRTTDHEGYIKDMKLYDLKQVNAGIEFKHFLYYDKTWEKERVPSLNEVLTLSSNKNIEINVELKTQEIDYKDIEEEVYQVVSSLSMMDKVTFSSFNMTTLNTLREINKKARIAYISRTLPENPVQFIEENDLNAIHLSAESVLESDEDLSDIMGYVRVWTVNDREEMKQLIDLGVDAIFTDYPEAAVKLKSRS